MKLEVIYRNGHYYWILFDGPDGIDQFEGVANSLGCAMEQVIAKTKRKCEVLHRRFRKINNQSISDEQMKTFQEFMNECYDIQETSLNRIRSKSEKGGMAILSGQRGDKSSKENKERSKRTERRIRGAGLPGPTKVSGRYTENPGTPQEKKVGEKSHVVSSGKMGKRKFKKNN